MGLKHKRDTLLPASRHSKRLKKEPLWLNEKGNVFFALFAAVALVGLLGAGIMSTMRGPLTTVVEVNRRVTAETQLRNAAAMIIAESVAETTYINPPGDDDGDCDSDGRIEPIEYKDGTGPTGGGLIPDSIGSDKRDPWGTDYGYCVWDPGTNTSEGGIGDLCDNDADIAHRLEGTDNTGDYIIAMVAAGPDKSFQTICANGSILTKGGDDVVVEFSYAAAATVSQGLWTLDPVDVGIAEIDKDLEVDGGATFSGDIDLTTTATAALRLGAASLFLPTQAEVSNSDCNGANTGILRINTTTTPDTLEICDGTWQPVSTPWVRKVDDELYYSAANVGIGNTDPTEALDVTGNIQTSGDLMIANAESVIWTSGAAITENSGGLDITGATDITGALTVSALTDLNGNLEVAGTSTLDGNISATDGTLEVLSNIDLTGGLDITGALTVSALTDLNGNLDVAGTSDLNGNVTMENDLTVKGDVQIDTDLEVTGLSTLNGNIVATDGTVNVSSNLDVTGNIDSGGTIDADDYNVDGNSFVPGTCPTGSFNRWTGTAWLCEDDSNGSGGSSSIWTESGSNIYYTSGNVGIGTTLPQTTLHTNGPIRVMGLNKSDQYMTLEGSNGIDARSKVHGQFDLNLGAGYSGGTNRGIAFSYNGTDHMKMNDEGKFGIGDLTPTEAKLVIKGVSASGSSLQSNISAFSGNGINITGSIGGASQDAITYQSGSSAGGTAIAFGRNGYDTFMDFYTNSSTNSVTGGLSNHVMRFDDNGSVGIGTVNPSSGTGGQLSLDVEGPLGATQFCDEDGNNCFTSTSIAGIAAGIFEVNSNVIRGISGSTDYTTDDFVIGSPQLADTGNANHDNRMFFDKSKGAFRAGGSSGAQWDDANVGTFSTAMGLANTASGNDSTAMGFLTTASGSSSTAMGDSTVASNFGSTAMGFLTTASGDSSTAMGGGTTASGAFSTAMGFVTHAGSYAETSVGQYGDNTEGNLTVWDADDVLFEIGNGISSGSRANAFTVLKSGAIGVGTVSPSSAGDQALELDVEGPLGATNYCDEDGNNCFTAASVSGATTVFETVSNVTRPTSGTADYSADDFVFGSPQLDLDGNTDHNPRMFFDKSKRAFRAGSTNGTDWDEAQIGTNSVAMGFQTIASGNSATATGWNSDALGDFSVAMGTANNARSYGEISFGIYSDNTAGNLTASVLTDVLFEIGNGTSSGARANAFTMLKNGSLILNGGTDITPATGGEQDLELEVVGDIGAINYCDENGNNCFTATSIASGAGGLWTAGSGDNIYYNSGTPRVGIGTDTPSEALDIVGDLQVSGDVHATMFGTPDATTNSTVTIQAGAGASGTQVIDMIAAGTNVFASNQFTTNIGGTSGRLVLRGGQVAVGDNTADAHFEISADGTTGGDVFMVSSDDNNDGDLFIIKETGNVGIGDTTPDFGTGGQLKLDVEGPVGAINYCDEDGNNCFTATDIATNASLWTANAGTDEIYFNSGTPMVGIGTDSPTRTLDVSGSATLSGDNRQIHFGTGGGGTYVGEFSNINTLQLRGGGNTTPKTVYIESNGRLGIGLANPNAQLQANVLTATTIGQIIRGASSQTANLTEWQNDSSVIQAYVAADGEIGATEFCDEDGNNCFTAASVSSGGSGLWTAGTGNDIYYNSGLSSSLSRVGIGTSSPDTALHIVGPGNHKGDIRLEGGSAITNSGVEMHNAVDGQISEVRGYGSHAFYAHRASSLVLSSKANNTGKIIFDTNTAGTDTTRMTILNSGNVGIGIGAPNYTLDVVGDINYSGSLSNVSDIRLKDNIVALNDRGSMIDKLDQIDTYSYHLKSDETKRSRFGVIAQELEEIFPELVNTQDDGFKSVNYVELIPPMIAASKELKAENDSLKIQLNAMKKDIEALKNNSGGHNGGLSQTSINLLFILLGFGMVAVLLRRRKS